MYNSTIEREDGVAMNKMQDHEDNLALELRDIKSAMKQLLEHSHAQTVSMASMREEMQRMREDLQDLREKTSPGGSNQAAVSEETEGEEGATSFEDQVIARLDNVENHQKYQEVLLRNQKWEYEYESPIPPDGSIDRNARRFLQQLKDKTCNMKWGVYRGAVSGSVSSSSLEIPIIELIGNQLQLHPLGYNPNTFLSHWHAFGNALKEYDYALRCFPKEERTIFRMVGVHLPTVILNVLSDALWSTQFKSFALICNNLCREGFQFALDYLERNPILEEFDLDGNMFMSYDDVNRLCGIIRDHPTLHILALSGCFGERPDLIEINGAAAIVDIMEAGASKLRHLDLSGNEIAAYEGDLQYTS